LKRYSVQCDLEVIADDEGQAEEVVAEILAKANIRHNIGEAVLVEGDDES
jgi:hypothetical protein